MSLSKMTCADCQLEIFDTDVELTRDALVHLTTCDDCRALDREVRLNSAALAELATEVLPVRVHAPRRYWPWAIAAAAALLAIVLSIPREQPKATNRAATTGSGPAPAVMTPDPAPPAPVRRATRPAKPKPQPQPEPVQVANAEPLLVKMLTDDPDVVIYWIVDPIQGE